MHCPTLTGNPPRSTPAPALRRFPRRPPPAKNAAAGFPALPLVAASLSCPAFYGRYFNDRDVVRHRKPVAHPLHHRHHGGRQRTPHLLLFGGGPRCRAFLRAHAL